jgi:hypothetical protein
VIFAHVFCTLPFSNQIRFYLHYIKLNNAYYCYLDTFVTVVAIFKTIRIVNMVSMFPVAINANTGFNGYRISVVSQVLAHSLSYLHLQFISKQESC